MAMKSYKRETLFEELKKYCSFAKENDFIEITEWESGEGYDVTISARNERMFSITYGEWILLKKMMKKITK